jgi:flagellar basal body P-ring formation protein FlgA
MLRFLLLALLWLSALPLRAEPLPRAWLQQLEQLAEQAAQAALPPEGRVAVQVGAPDARLRLAPCQRVEPFLPAGQPLWGRGRLGLRCLQGATRWSISVPMTVRVFAPGWAAMVPLPAGVVLQADQLERRVVEWTLDPSPVLAQDLPPAGRQLVRPLQAGEAVRQAHLKARQWFAAGDPVRLLMQGEGFAVRGAGQALAVGLEGQTSRVRLESGRILSVWPVGERLAEVNL